MPQLHRLFSQTLEKEFGPETVKFRNGWKCRFALTPDIIPLSPSTFPSTLVSGDRKVYRELVLGTICAEHSKHG